MTFKTVIIASQNLICSTNTQWEMKEKAPPFEVSPYIDNYLEFALYNELLFFNTTCKILSLEVLFCPKRKHNYVRLIFIFWLCSQTLVLKIKSVHPLISASGCSLSAGWAMSLLGHCSYRSLAPYAPINYYFG